MTEIVRKTNCSSQSPFSDTEIKRVCSVLRALKSREIKRGATESEAVRLASRAIPLNFPQDSLPLAFKHKTDIEITDSEVRQLVSELKALGKFTETPVVDNSTAQHSATVERQDFQRSATPVGCTAKQAQQYDFVTGISYLFQLSLYAIIVPTTAEVFKTALEGLNSPLPSVFISYAVALAIDFVAIQYLIKAIKSKGKRQQECIAVTALILLANIGGLAYKTYTTSSRKNKSLIEAQANATEKARLHWLGSKWRKAVDPVACEDEKTTDCGTPYTQASRARQDNYNIELSKLERLKDWHIDWLHVGYFAFLWVLIGLLALLPRIRGEVIA